MVVNLLQSEALAVILESGTSGDQGGTKHLTAVLRSKALFKMPLRPYKPQCCALITQPLEAACWLFIQDDTHVATSHKIAVLRFSLVSDRTTPKS